MGYTKLAPCMDAPSRGAVDAFDAFVASLPLRSRHRVWLAAIERGRAWVEVTTPRGDRVTLFDRLDSFPSSVFLSRLEVLL